MSTTLRNSLDLTLSLLEATLAIPSALPLLKDSIQDEQLLDLMDNFVDSFGLVIVSLKARKELIDNSTKESISNLYDRCLKAIESLATDGSLSEVIQQKAKKIQGKLEDYGGVNLVVAQPPDVPKPKDPAFAVRPNGGHSDGGSPLPLPPPPPWPP